MTVAFTCHPAERLKLGRFEFKKASLKLESEDDVAEFRALLEKQPPFIRTKIRELSVAAADAVAAKFKAGQKITGIDTTRNSMGAPQPQAAGNPTDPVGDESEGEGGGDDGADTNVNDSAPSPLNFGKRTAE
jgi:hypothetical protein